MSKVSLRDIFLIVPCIFSKIICPYQDFLTDSLLGFSILYNVFHDAFALALLEGMKQFISVFRHILLWRKASKSEACGGKLTK